MKELFKRTPRQGEAEQKAAGAKQKAEAEANGPQPKFTWNKSHGAADAGSPQGKQEEREKPVAHSEIPDNLWTRCTACKELIYTKEFENNKKVCHKCNHHARLTARERLAFLVDENSFEETNAGLITGDPLLFTSLTEASYPDKAAETRRKSGVNEALTTGFAQIQGLPVGVAVCDFGFLGGSMGSVFGEKLVRLVEEAVRRDCPVLTISASGGARMHEGMFSLMQMAKTTASLNRLGEAGLPHISLLTDPCTGGVFASYASVADVILAEPGALIGFAGPRVIEQITKQKLPAGFQTAEFLLENGMIDQVVPRKELNTTIACLLKLYRVAATRRNNISANQLQQEVSHAW